jgi:hypothetical protein
MTKLFLWLPAASFGPKYPGVRGSAPVRPSPKPEACSDD